MYVYYLCNMVRRCLYRFKRPYALHNVRQTSNIKKTTTAPCYHHHNVQFLLNKTCCANKIIYYRWHDSIFVVV